MIYEIVYRFCPQASENSDESVGPAEEKGRAKNWPTAGWKGECRGKTGPSIGAEEVDCARTRVEHRWERSKLPEDAGLKPEEREQTISKLGPTELILSPEPTL